MCLKVPKMIFFFNLLISPSTLSIFNLNVFRRFSNNILQDTSSRASRGSRILPLDIWFRIADKSAFEGDGVTVVWLSNHRSFSEGRFNPVVRYGCFVAYVRHKRSTYRKLFVHIPACLLNPFAALINARLGMRDQSLTINISTLKKIFLMLRNQAAKMEMLKNKFSSNYSLFNHLSSLLEQRIKETKF
jgi:hypothetical protein